jgi:NTE family protein
VLPISPLSLSSNCCYWPSKGGDSSVHHSNFDEVKERPYDINLSDKTVYDEKEAVIISDYVKMIKKLTDLALSRIGSKEKKETIQKEVDSIYDMKGESRRRDGERRSYGELIHGRAKISNVTRIEFKADSNNSISNKAFDITKTTIENLIAQGKWDADEILQSSSKGK